MSAKPYLLLVDVVGATFVYGGDACPQRDLTCGTAPFGLVVSVVLASALASIAAFPIVRTLEVGEA